MEPHAHSARIADAQPDGLVTESPRSRCVVLPFGAAPPPGADVVVALPDGRRLAFVPRGEGAEAGGEVVPDPLLRGNAFLPVHESARALAAMLSIAAGRRVETGPESERVFVFLRGRGLVFLENGDTFGFEPETLVVVPPGEPARVWSQGPDDALAVVLQPRGAEPEPRRTLAGEIAKRRGGGEEPE